MWKDSNELLDYAIRQIKKAMKENKEKVEIKIVLTDSFFGNSKQDIKKIVDKFKIKEITEKLRDEYVNYTIRSTVKGGSFSALLTFENAPCEFYYQIVWEITLSKKET